MDQGVRYVVTLQDINVNSGLKAMENSAMRAEGAVTSLGSALKSIGNELGVAFGIREAINIGKEWVQGAADYETAVKRIKFASESLAEGAKNINFIGGEADKFKIPLQSATDAYGKFLAMVSNSGIASDKVRSLHDQLLLIGKVKGLGDGQLDAAVMNLGKMLESGSLDARHFRPLEQQLSGIGAFVAKELGISVHQLAILRNKGKMTQIDPRVLLTAIEKQAKSLEKFLPESTTTIQSQLNDLDNAWLRFKNDLVFANGDDLKALFDTLKSGVAFLTDHMDGVIRTTRALIDFGKIFIEYKVLMSAAGLAQKAFNSIAGVSTTQIVAQSSAYAGLNAEVALLNANLETMIGLQATASLTQSQAINGAMYASLNAKNLPIGIPLAGNPLANVASYATSGIIGVGLAYIGLEAMESLTNLFTGKEGDEGYRFKWTDMFTDPEYKKAGRAGQSQAQHDIYQDHITSAFIRGNKFFDTENDLFFMLKKQQAIIDSNPQINGQKFDLIESIIGKNKYGELNAHTNADLYDKLTGLGYKLPKLTHADNGKGDGTGSGSIEKILPPNDKVTGQRVITYNITIKEINGQKIGTQSVAGNEADTEDVAIKLRDIIISIVNDSQIRAGD